MLQAAAVLLKVAPDTKWFVLGHFTISTNTPNFGLIRRSQWKDLGAEVRDGNAWRLAAVVHIDSVHTAHKSVVAPTGQLVGNINGECSWHHWH